MDLAATILRIPLDEPHWLFPAGDADAASVWKELSLRYHPDVAGAGTADVQARLGALKTARRKALKNGTWQGPTTHTFHARDGRIFRANSVLMENTDTGRVLHGRERVFLVFNESAVEWGEKAWKNIGSLEGLHRDEKMKKQFSPIQPKPEHRIPLANNELLLVLKKPDDMVPLSWVFAMARIMDVRIEPKHLAWMTSSLMDFSCWCEATGLHFNSPEPFNIQVSLARHIVMPWGGWHFAVKSNEKVTALTGIGVEAARIVGGGGPVTSSSALLNEGIRILIKRLASENGVVLPKPWMGWIESTPVGRRAWEDYAAWEKAREASLGPRAFQVFPFGPQRILAGLPALLTDGSPPPAPRVEVGSPRKTTGKAA